MYFRCTYHLNEKVPSKYWMEIYSHLRWWLARARYPVHQLMQLTWQRESEPSSTPFSVTKTVAGCFALHVKRCWIIHGNLLLRVTLGQWSIDVPWKEEKNWSQMLIHLIIFKYCSPKQFEGKLHEIKCSVQRWLRLYHHHHPHTYVITATTTTAIIYYYYY